MSAPSEADVGKLANSAWSKANHQARTELCTQIGRHIRYTRKALQEFLEKMTNE